MIVIQGTLTLNFTFYWINNPSNLQYALAEYDIFTLPEHLIALPFCFLLFEWAFSFIFCAVLLSYLQHVFPTLLYYVVDIVYIVSLSHCLHFPFHTLAMFRDSDVSKLNFNFDALVLFCWYKLNAYTHILCIKIYHDMVVYQKNNIKLYILCIITDFVCSTKVRGYRIDFH